MEIRLLLSPASPIIEPLRDYDSDQATIDDTESHQTRWDPEWNEPDLETRTSPTPPQPMDWGHATMAAGSWASDAFSKFDGNDTSAPSSSRSPPPRLLAPLPSSAQQLQPQPQPTHRPRLASEMMNGSDGERDQDCQEQFPAKRAKRTRRAKQPQEEPGGHDNRRQRNSRTRSTATESRQRTSLPEVEENTERNFPRSGRLGVQGRKRSKKAQDGAVDEPTS